MDQTILELNQKLDLLTSQLAYLTEQAQAAERARESRQELVDTMMPIARDGMRTLSDEMGEVQDFLDPQDLIRLLKKVVRHLPQIEALVDQIDGVGDLLEIAGPISKEAMAKTTEVMGDLEKKGYFGFAEGGMQMIDNIVTSFNKEDVVKLSDNIVLILDTVKDMTQPEIMNFVRGTLLVAESEVQKPVDISYGALLAQMRDPSVRRGLALTMRVLRVVGAQGKSV